MSNDDSKRNSTIVLVLNIVVTVANVLLAYFGG